MRFIRCLVIMTVMCASAIESYGQSFSVNDLLSVFPLSNEAKAAFRERVQIRRLSQEQAGALLWQLMAEGETLLPKADQEELASFYWKAVGTLTPEEQMFIQQVNLRVSQGGGHSATGQDRAQALVQKGFSQLPKRDNDRFLQLRVKSIEYALLRPTQAREQYRANIQAQPRSITSTLTPEQKRRRIQELTEKAISLLPERDRARYLELQMTPANQLTRAQYEERVRYSERIMKPLSDSEMQELQELTLDIIGK